jgi:hypothetical protein
MSLSDAVKILTPSKPATATPILPPTAATATTPICPPLATSAEQIPVAMSTDDLKAGPGSLATAIVAPKAGDIPVTAGTPVVVVAKALLDSPTVKKLLRVVYVAWGAFATFIGYKILEAGGIFGLDWTSIMHGGINLAVVTALAAYGINLKGRDNDPVINTSLMKGTP